MVDKVNDINQQIGGTGRLIVVSNRVADPRRDRKAGGLAVAVGEALQATGGGWFGWSGEIRPDAEKIKPIFKQVDGVNIVTIDLTSIRSADNAVPGRGLVVHSNGIFPVCGLSGGPRVPKPTKQRKSRRG